jgi:tetratricopeptide (TPR) repeat protein
MKKNVMQALAATGRNALPLTALGSMVFALLISLVLIKHVGGWVGRRHRRESLARIEAAAQAQTLAETRQSIAILDKMRRQAGPLVARQELLRVLGDLHRRYVELDGAETEDTYHLSVARRLYMKALSLSRTARSRWPIRYGLAKIDYLEGDYDNAQSVFKTLSDDQTPADKRADLLSLRCRCLIALGDTSAAADLLDTTLGRYTAGPIHDHAQILLAELLLAKVKKQQAADRNTTDSDRQQTTVARTDAARASAALEELLENLPPEDGRRLRALNNLLELCIVEDDVDKAYQTVRHIEGIAGHRSQQIRSYSLLARLEQKQGNLQEAEKVLRFCIEHYPEHQDTVNIRIELFEMLKQQGNWQTTLQAFKAICQGPMGRKTRQWALEELDPRRSRSLAAKAGTKPEYVERLHDLQRILQTIAADTPVRWLNCRELILYLQGALAFHAGQYAEAETAFQRYLAFAPHGTELADVLALDANCADRLGRNPAVQAFRAHRYLTLFPRGPRSEAMFDMLMQNYYRMQLYEDDLAIAKSAFIKAIMQTGNDTTEPLSLPVLRAALIMARCSSRLGRASTAARLYYRCAQQLDELDPGADFYNDWADAALTAKQQREAIRRLEVGARRLPAGPEREYIMAREVAERCRLGLPEALAQARTLVNELGETADPVRTRLRYMLLQQVLENCLDTAPDDIPDVLQLLTEATPGAPANAYWALRCLGRQETGNVNSALARRLRRIFPNETTGKGSRPASAYVLRCLDHVDVAAEIERQTGELKSRGPNNG